MISLLASLAFAGELSLSGRVVAINRDSIAGGYFIKFQGMSLSLKAQPGEAYQCLRQGLNSQEILVFSFNPKTMQVSECQPQVSTASNLLSTSVRGL